MANAKAPRDVELGNRQTQAADPPAPPTVLEQARLGRLDLFETELENGNYPLDFKAGRAVHFNRTPLHLAAMEGHEEIVEFILSHRQISREVVNAKDRFGYTPLHLAARHSHESVVQLLTTSSLVLPDRFLAATSEPDDIGGHFGGYTPLHFAALTGHIAIVRLILRQPNQVEFAYDPVNLHALTWDGDTPLDAAQNRFYPSRLEMYIRYDLQGFFSYDTARRENYEKLVQLFLLSDPNWLQQYRERTTMAANAILVGAALVVAASFGSWSQPPGGIPAPDSAFGNALKYWNSVFYVCVTFAFAFSVVALTVGTMATLPPNLEVSSFHEVMRLRTAVGIAQLCLLVAVLFLLFCFSFAGSIVLHNFATIYRTSTYYVITWLPIIAFVYVMYIILSWELKKRPEYGMKFRMIMIYTAVFYGVIYGITRFIKK